MLFVELRSRLHDLVTRYGLLETLDHKHFYDEVDDATRRDRPGGLIVPVLAIASRGSGRRRG